MHRRPALRVTLTGAAILATAGTAVVATVPDRADANVAVTCTAAELSGFVPGRAITASDLSVWADGRLVRSGPVSFTGPTAHVPLAQPLEGSPSVRARVTVGRESWSAPARLVTCSPTPAPEPPGEVTPPASPPVSVTPPPLTPQPRPRLTCPQLRKAGAGARSLRARGCKVNVTPPRPSFTCPPRPVTPAWQKILRKRHGWTCPSTPPRRVTPAVTGEHRPQG